MTRDPIRFPLLRWLMVGGLTILLAGCAFPKRDYSFMPDASVIQVQLRDGRWVAVPPECARLFNEPPRSLYDSRPQVPYGCATYTNLANSVANPRDLVAPGQYDGQQADNAAGAVTRYRENKVTPLRQTNSTKKPSSSGNSNN